MNFYLYIVKIKKIQPVLTPSLYSDDREKEHAQSFSQVASAPQAILTSANSVLKH